MTSSVEHRVKFLDAWRLIAVCLVVVSHLLVFSGISVADKSEILARFGRYGNLGVLIFFFISGYVMYWFID